MIGQGRAEIFSESDGTVCDIDQVKLNTKLKFRCQSIITIGMG